jgi:hypothetical protein
MLPRARGVQPALGRPLLAPFRHNARGVRPVAKRDRQHLTGRRHLQVERQRDLRSEARNILVADVPPVLAKMCGNPVGARFRRQQRSAHRVRVIAAARIPDSGNVVDIDAEADAAMHRHETL